MSSYQSGGTRSRLAIAVLVCAMSLGLLSCASVPREAVELSYIVGQDIQQLHKGYRKTIRTYFEQMRQRGLDVIENRWTPIYLKAYVKTSGLFEHLNDTSFSESERYGDLETWARTAIEDIDNKRNEFLDSLQRREDTLLASVDDAFSRVIRANATVTGHLHSVVKVQELQDDIFKSAGLEGIRDRISDGIAKASEFTAEVTGEFEKATRALEAAP